jgi:hypothetical protein
MNKSGAMNAGGWGDHYEMLGWKRPCNSRDAGCWTSPLGVKVQDSELSTLAINGVFLDRVQTTVD